ncbi:MAG: type 2 isopentenyl-diphosphate Delta-isomerase [bacterium]
MSIEDRKQDHIDLSLDQRSQSSDRPFSRWRLPYKALPEINLDDVSTATSLFGKTLSQPLIIASMTGGTKHAGTINKNLAIAAEKNQVALGVGSQRIALEKSEARATFELVRKHAPTTVLFANMGAIQLNNGRSTTDYIEVINMIQADGLYLHVNPLQEALQPGGDTNYADLIQKIERLVGELDTPVFVKEVGHGIDGETAKMLFDIGVAGIDVAGVGGTSYAWIEAQRAKLEDFSKWFHDIGIPTDDAVIAAAAHKSDNNFIVASGGMRDPVAALKSRALGADFYSNATGLLKRAILDEAETVAAIELARRGLQIAMFSCGVSNWDEARKIKLNLK